MSAGHFPSRLLLLLLLPAVLAHAPGCLAAGGPVPTPTVGQARPAETVAPSPTRPAASPDADAAIVVTSPREGDRVTSPIRVLGTASVFEGTVQVRVKDAAGRVVGEGFGTASAGAPGRGQFRVNVSYQGSGPGTIEVFSESPRDGAVLHLVTIPVVLG